MQNEENNNSVNSIDNNINIYDSNNISGVDNIIQNEEKNLVNNSTVNININDIIRNNVTPAEKNSEENSYMKPTLELVDSYPLILHTDNSDLTETEARTSSDTATATSTPILRLRGGVGEEE
jgi:hypothetical protein